jgi:glycosyltransferase involved in cell wall biosynthesis
MHKPRVSVIIDNFNYERFLAAAVDSALEQTYPNCEVIVVDDGSTDSSRDILRNYAGRALLLLQQNGGQAAAFNAGFEKSSGDLILFLDSDDALHPEAISDLINHWDDSFTKIQFPLEIIDAEGNRSGLSMPSNRLSEGNVVPSLVAIGRYVTSPTSGNLYARSFLKQVMPMPVTDWTQGNDSYLNTMAGFAGPIGAVHRHLGYYRVHGESMSTVIFKQRINLAQIEKLLQHGRRQQSLVNSIAAAKGLTVNPNGLEKHWLQLKLTLTYQKLALNGQSFHGSSLIGTAWSFVKSVFLDHEVACPRKLQLASWAIVCASLPRNSAEKMILYGFDLAPASKLQQLFRRSWKRHQADIVHAQRKGA